MGDLVSPRRRDVYDRLRRRIEHYRSHNQSHLARQDAQHGQYEQQRQDTLLYQQRWHESKSKRTSKSNKANRDTNSQHTNNQLTQKLKRKLDNSNSSSGHQAVGGGESGHIDRYNFEDDQSPPAKKCAQNTNSSVPQQQQNSTSASTSAEAQHCLSVNIDVQQISNASARVDNTSSSQIKLTFQSTVHTATTATNNNCKQEQQQPQPPQPQQQPQQQATGPGCENNASNSSYQDSIGLEDVELDELNDILSQLEKEQGGLPAELLKEIEEGGFRDQTQPDPITGQQAKDTTAVNNNKVNNSLHAPFAGESSVKNNSPASGMFAEPVYEQQQSASSSSAGYCAGSGAATGGVPVASGAAAMPPTSATGYCHRPIHPGPSPPIGPVHGDMPPLSTLAGDTGPAAETLKQMAAQHQHQDYNKQHHSYDAYDGYRRYPGTYAAAPPHQGYMAGQAPPPSPHQPNAYPYNQQMAARPQYMGHMKQQTGEMTGYGATKPLSHFSPMPDTQVSGSSLQRLQNQVQSHFSQAGGGGGGMPMQAGAPQMQMSQSQQLHMSSHHQQHHMHLSQSQHMHVQGGPGGISMAQQQSFSMGGGTGPYPQPSHPPTDPKMQQQQYMNRPPPEYKMPTPGAATAGPGYHSPQTTPQPTTGTPTGNGNGNGGGSNGATSNPLETMQNMVNQTSQSQPQQGSGGDMGSYTTGNGNASSTTPQQGTPGTIKTEAPRSSPLPASSSATTPTSTYPQASTTSRPTMVNGVQPKTEPTPPHQNNYTSALMRGQRPPNVNVGPDGLNISQPRPTEWPRGPAGMMGGVGMGQQQQQPGMMQYPQQQQHQYAGGQYGGARMHMTPQQQQHMAAMQQQQQQQQHHARTMGGGGMRPQHHMMMMQQQQHMHMQQQHHHQQQQHAQNGHMQATNMRMSSAMPPGAQQPQHYGGNTAVAPPPVAGGTEFALDFLDSSQGQASTDFFGDSSTSEFNLLDDILNGK